MSESCFNCKKNAKFDQKTVSLLCVKSESGAHKQLTFYFQMWKYFCRHLHSSLISMLLPVLNSAGANVLNIQFLRNLRISPTSYSVTLERLGSYKPSILLDLFVSYEETEVLWIRPRYRNYLPQYLNKPQCYKTILQR